MKRKSGLRRLPSHKKGNKIVWTTRMSICHSKDKKDSATCIPMMLGETKVWTSGMSICHS